MLHLTQKAFFFSDNRVGLGTTCAGRLFGLHDESSSYGVGLTRCHGRRIWAEAKPYMGEIIYFTLPS